MGGGQTADSKNLTNGRRDEKSVEPSSLLNLRQPMVGAQKKAGSDECPNPPHTGGGSECNLVFVGRCDVKSACCLGKAYDLSVVPELFIEVEWGERVI